MKIGFTGTQRGMTDAQKNTLRKMVPNDAELHHGDCVGTDAEAHDIFRFYGLRCVGHPPSIQRNERTNWWTNGVRKKNT